MGSQGKLACCLAVFLGAIVLAQCIPMEVVYRGNRCDRPTRLDFQVNVPLMQKPKKYSHAEYGYKIDVPAPGKTHVSYTFDYTVEEPRTPRAVKPTKWNLYAKVDPYGPKKDDYEDSYAPAPAPSGCGCGQSGSSQRYVYKRVPPCKCQPQSCKCNLRRAPPATSPNVFSWSTIMGPMVDASAQNSIRRKREIRDRPYYRRSSRKREAARQGRFVKLYHKNLNDKRNTLFDFDGFSQGKRKTKKVLLPHLFPKKVKRDIKGEYDLLEKERDQMDLTLPEIIQYMPETLQPNFKRGQCATSCSSGCALAREIDQRDDNNSLESSVDENSEKMTPPTANENRPSDDPPQDNEKNDERNEPANGSNEERSDDENSVSNLVSKRNAANYNREIPSSSAASASQFPVQPLPPSSCGAQSAYTAKPRQSYEIPNNPMPRAPPSAPAAASQSAYSAIAQHPVSLPRPQYLYDHLGRQYVQQDGRLQVTAASATVADPTGTDSTPLRYAGDLDSLQYGQLGPATYPVHHISNHQLDRIISDIVYRHPDFVDATTHYGGGLIDPTPVQEAETKGLLKKLIDGRVNMWFRPGAGYEANYAARPLGGYSTYK